GQGGEKALPDRGPPAARPPNHSPRRARRIQARAAGGALSGADGGARPQARGPCPAHAPGRHRQDGVTAAVRGAGAARSRRDTGPPARCSSRHFMRLLLARHGQSLWNEVRRFQGGTDVALSDTGRAQARALGQALRRYRPVTAYVSPRAGGRETAEIALAGAGVPLVHVEELRELSLGAWEGCTIDEIRGQVGDPYGAWVRAPLDCPPPGAEPLPDVSRRVLGAMTRISAAHPNGDAVLIGAHGGGIRGYSCPDARLPFE